MMLLHPHLEPKSMKACQNPIQKHLKLGRFTPNRFKKKGALRNSEGAGHGSFDMQWWLITKCWQALAIVSPLISHHEILKCPELSVKLRHRRPPWRSPAPVRAGRETTYTWPLGSHPDLKFLGSLGVIVVIRVVCVLARFKRNRKWNLDVNGFFQSAP